VLTEIRKTREVGKKEKRRKLFPIRLTDFARLKKDLEAENSGRL
jgi:hypothetical protein